VKVKIWRFNNLRTPSNYFYRTQENTLELTTSGIFEDSLKLKKSPMKTQFISLPVKKRFNFGTDLPLPCAQKLKRPQLCSTNEAFSVAKLLKDLPNFVINGKQAHVHSIRSLTPQSRKKRSWLAELSEMKDNSACTSKSDVSTIMSPKSSGQSHEENTTPKRRRVSISKKSTNARSSIMDRFVKQKREKLVERPVIV